MSGRTNVLVTRMGIWFLGALAAEDWVERRLEFSRTIGQPAFEKLETDWHWVWVTAAERFDQVSAAAPEYVTVIRQELFPDSTDPVNLLTPNDAIPGERFLVARLDSDDAFLPEALDWAATQEWGQRVLVNFPNGWRWYLGKEVVTANILASYQGHFLAVTQESRERMFDTGGVHMKARRGREVVTYQPRAYLQMIHGENVTNRRREKMKVFGPLRGEAPEDVLARFGVAVPV